jgi:AraC-like DNA-binding protein
MARELSRTLSLGEVAAQVAASRRQLQRVFAGEGTTFRGRLRDLRIQRALEMLREGLGVDEAAKAVGYASTPAFTRAFKAVVGKSPRAGGA